MNFFLENWMLVVIALASASMLLLPTLNGAKGGALGTAAAVQLINRERAVVVDVSDAQEFANAHVGGAKSVPLDQLQARLPLVVKNKSLPVILVCQTGARAARAQAIAKKLGYEQAQVLHGGLKAWKEASLPVEAA